MRPGTNTRGSLNSSSGQPPGTGVRPGSGRKVPGTARLRTGVAPSGAGTEAAQGIALSASVNVSDRPVTGHGVMGMKVQNQQGGRIVQDSAYYIGLLRTKIKEVNEETNKLGEEIDLQSKDNSQYTQLERRYEALVKGKETLEGQLADYNLALDKVTILNLFFLIPAFLHLFFRPDLQQIPKMYIKWPFIWQRRIVKLVKI